MRIEVINEKSPYLKRVKELGRANSATLGFLPEGAFDDYASKENIIVALDKNNNCVAYLLYRITDRRVIIVHLCVDECSRGCGITRDLIDFLSKRTKSCKGIGLHCRRDYTVNSLWPNLGFVAISEKAGRSIEGKLLTYWWRDYNQPNLFSDYINDKLNDKINVVIDANVFIDLKESSESTDSFYLMENWDWLQEEIVFLITKELYNEIHRHSDKAVRDKSKAFACEFDRIETDVKIFEEKVILLKNMFPDNMTPSDESDLRQLAWTIAGDAHFFITRDNLLLDKSDKIYDKFGVLVMRPTDLIRRIDEVINESKYQPARLAGSQIRIKHVKSGNESVLKNIFLCYNQGEKRVDFESDLREYLANADIYDVYIIEDNQNDPIAILVYDNSYNDILTVPMFRVANSGLASTVARYLIKKIILDSINNKKTVIDITDSHLIDSSKFALMDNGFLYHKNKWIK